MCESGWIPPIKLTRMLIDWLTPIFWIDSRELWEVKQQREEFARDLMRKDTQMKEMQQRLESGEGCKLIRNRSALDPIRNPPSIQSFHLFTIIDEFYVMKFTVLLRDSFRDSFIPFHSAPDSIRPQSAIHNNWLFFFLIDFFPDCGIGLIIEWDSWGFGLNSSESVIEPQSARNSLSIKSLMIDDSGLRDRIHRIDYRMGFLVLKV